MEQQEIEDSHQTFINKFLENTFRQISCLQKETEICGFGFAETYATNEECSKCSVSNNFPQTVVMLFC